MLRAEMHVVVFQKQRHISSEHRPFNSGTNKRTDGRIVAQCDNEGRRQRKHRTDPPGRCGGNLPAGNCQAGKRDVVEFVIRSHSRLGIEEHVRLHSITDSRRDIGARLDERLVYQTGCKVPRRQRDNHWLPFDIACLHAREVIEPLNSEHEPADLIVAAELPAPNNAARGVIAEIGWVAFQYANRVVPTGSRPSAPDIDADPTPGPAVDGTGRWIGAEHRHIRTNSGKRQRAERGADDHQLSHGYAYPLNPTQCRLRHVPSLLLKGNYWQRISFQNYGCPSSVAPLGSVPINPLAFLDIRPLRVGALPGLPLRSHVIGAL